MSSPRISCIAKTRDEVSSEVDRILTKYQNFTGILTRDRMIEEMGVRIPPRTKHEAYEGQLIWLRQAISRVMKKKCEDPDFPWVPTDFVQSPSWKRKPS